VYLLQSISYSILCHISTEIVWKIHHLQEIKVHEFASLHYCAHVQLITFLYHDSTSCLAALWVKKVGGQDQGRRQVFRVRCPGRVARPRRGWVWGVLLSVTTRGEVQSGEGEIFGLFLVKWHILVRFEGLYEQGLIKALRGPRPIIFSGAPLHTHIRTLHYNKSSKHPSSGGFRPGPGAHPLPQFCSSPQFHSHPWFFAKITQISVSFAFLNFRKLGKFAASIELPKTKSTSGGLRLPDQGLCKRTPLGVYAPRPQLYAQATALAMAPVPPPQILRARTATASIQ